MSKVVVPGVGVQTAVTPSNKFGIEDNLLLTPSERALYEEFQTKVGKGDDPSAGRNFLQNYFARQGLKEFGDNEKVVLRGGQYVEKDSGKPVNLDFYGAGLTKYDIVKYRQGKEAEARETTPLFQRAKAAGVDVTPTKSGYEIEQLIAPIEAQKKALKTAKTNFENEGGVLADLETIDVPTLVKATDSLKLKNELDNDRAIHQQRLTQQYGEKALNPDGTLRSESALANEAAAQAPQFLLNKEQFSLNKSIAEASAENALRDDNLAVMRLGLDKEKLLGEFEFNEHS